jgi:hypothetical protein
MAPELLYVDEEHQAARPSKKSDVYALAMVAVEVITTHFSDTTTFTQPLKDFHWPSAISQFASQRCNIQDYEGRKTQRGLWTGPFQNCVGNGQEVLATGTGSSS